MLDAIIKPIESIEKPNCVNKSVIVAIIPPFSFTVEIANWNDRNATIINCEIVIVTPENSAAKNA